jgi:hypothetical protein
MVGGEGGGGLGGQLVELDGGDAGVDALDDLLRDFDGVNMLLWHAYSFNTGVSLAGQAEDDKKMRERRGLW